MFFCLVSLHEVESFEGFLGPRGQMAVAAWRYQDGWNKTDEEDMPPERPPGIEDDKEAQPWWKKNGFLRVVEGA